jgi:hypothetical protein
MQPSRTVLLAPAQIACGPSAEEGPWKAARQVFGSGAGSSCSSWDCVPKQTTEFLIASLADPEQTHLSLHFDRELESLMWAVEDSGYAFQAYWLPWVAASEKAASTLGDRECLKRQKAERRKQPGLLVFRRIAAPAHFLFVWLTGETPTSGIDQAMLTNAIEYSRIVDSSLVHFRLLGPSFSGSLAPLYRQIDGIKTPGLFFQIVSGAATNYQAIEDFRAAIKGKGIFESSIENDKHAFALFVNYLRTQFYCPLFSRLGSDETAILSEDETVYGDLGLDWPASQNDHHRWMTLRYPREIARLRNAAPDDSAPPSMEVNPPATGGVPFTLRDQAGDDTSHSDSVNTFSTQQSPVSQQAVLLTIASTLRREHASYTGIVATDVLDSVFLAHFLRASNPDTRLFTIDADLLFLREAETQPLYGMLAVTTYPLFSRNQHWTRDELALDHMPRRIQFSGRYAEGIYNACRRLIVPAASKGSKSAARSDAYLEYERPSDASREVPPLWLTVVGRDGYWPIALLDETKTINGDKSTITNFSGPGIPNPNTGGEKFHPEEPSRGWQLLFAISCLFCFGHVFYMLNILSWSPELPEESGLRSSMRGLMNGLHHIFNVYPDDHRPEAQERPFLLTATLSMFSSLLLFSFPLVPFRSYWRYRLYFAIALICLACLFYIAIKLTDLQVYKRIVWLAWSLSIPFLGVWIYLNLRTDYHSGEFFAYRSLNLGNAVSPGIPIVLLAVAFYGWAWIHLHRESEVRVRRGVRPDWKKLDEWPWPPKLAKPIIATDHAIEDIQAPDLWIPALGALFLWFVVLFPPESLRSFEFYFYDFLYWSILAGLYWCISLVLVQFIRCWRQLHKLLIALESHPIRHAFSRLDKEISWIPLVSTVPARSLVVSVRSFDCLRSIHSQNLELGVGDPVIEECLRETNALEEEIRLRIAERKQYNDIYRQVQRVLDKAARHILEKLAATHWEKGYSESVVNELHRLQQSVPLQDRDKVVLLQEEFLALRMLIFIRYVLRQLRNWIGFIAAGFVISIISMNSYPFQGHRWIGLTSLFTLLAIGTGVGFVFAEMDRDAILSRLSNTKANELGPTFFLRLARFGALPLLTVLAAQFPSINRALFFWIKPAFEALK